MRVAIITAAGISSRFNEGCSENDKVLKAIYHEMDLRESLLFHLLDKCSFADKVIIVGGYKIEDLYSYCKNIVGKERIVIIYNNHYADLASGYSLYLGIQEALKYRPDEVLFVEGDLDIDRDSFDRVIKADGNVLTYNYEPIYANKAVVLYCDQEGNYKYAFNSKHGLLKLETPCSCILNSGQLWKFTDIDKLRMSNDRFYQESPEETNLQIIQNYLDYDVDCELVGLTRWTNCNTRDDFRKILSYWKVEV